MLRKCRPILVFVVLAFALVSGCSIGKQQRNDAESHYMLGVSYLQEQNSTQALKEFLQAAELAPGRADVQQALAQAYYQKKAYQLAEKHYLKALELTPDDPQIENNLAALYLNMQRWNEAIRYFRKASKNLLFSSAEVALTGAGVASFQKGDNVEAIAFYKEAIAANPGYAPAFLHLGEVYSAMDKPDLAVGEYRHAISLVPDYAGAHYQLALAYLKLGDRGRAESHFREVIRITPEGETAMLSRDYLKLLH